MCTTARSADLTSCVYRDLSVSRIANNDATTTVLGIPATASTNPSWQTS